jgi:hypothetical protein
MWLHKYCGLGYVNTNDLQTLFTDLAAMFPRDGLALLFSGLLENLRVPLVELSAVGCFVPLLGPLPLR